MSEEIQKALEEDKPLIDVDLGSNGRLVLRTVEDIEQWLNNERALWRPLAKVVGFDAPLHSHLTTRQVKKLDSFAALLARIKEQTAPSEKAARAADLAADIKNHYSPPDYAILAQSPRGLFVKSLMERAPVAGSYAAGYFIAANMTPSQKLSHEGIAKAALFEAGAFESNVSERAALATAALEKMKGQWVADVETIKGQRETEKRLVEGLVSEYGGHLDGSKTTFEKQLEKQAEAHHEQLRTAQNALTALQQTYTEFMRLKAPVEYWTKRETYHQRRAAVVIRVAVLWSIAAFLGISLLTMFLWSEMPQPTFKDGTSALTTTWPLSLLVLGLVLAIWSIRILVRVLLSQLHLEADSGERAILAETYLALTKEGAALGSEDRAIVLRALFRNAATGIVKDDAAPASPIELITRDRDGRRP